MSRVGHGVDDKVQLKATRMVTRDLSPWTDDDAGIDLVVEHVLGAWSDGDPDRDEPCELTRFWNRYANRVEFAEPGTGDEFRAEFCPAEPGPMDTDDYYRAVWRSHIAGLRARAGRPDQAVKVKRPSVPRVSGRVATTASTFSGP